MTNLYIGYVGGRRGAILDTRINVHKAYIYTEYGQVIQFDYSNVKDCWLKLFGDFELVTRRKVAYTKNEVFAVKHKGYSKDEYDLYIPYSALQGKYIGKEEREMGDGDYIYIYQVYEFNGNSLKKFTEDDFTITEVNGDRIKVMVLDNYRQSDERKRFLKIANDIEKTCMMSVDLWKLKKILEHYKITKIRKKSVE